MNNVTLGSAEAYAERLRSVDRYLPLPAERRTT